MSNDKGCAVLGRSVMPDSLRPCGLQPARLLCPWDSPGKNTGVGCHALLQGIFPPQGSNPCLLCLLHCRWILYPLSYLGSLMFTDDPLKLFNSPSPDWIARIMAFNWCAHKQTLKMVIMTENYKLWDFQVLSDSIPNVRKSLCSYPFATTYFMWVTFLLI